MTCNTRNYQFPDRYRTYDIYESEGANELRVEICRRKTRADLSIAVRGPASEFIYEEFAFSWLKVLCDPKFLISKRDRPLTRGLSPTSCYLGGLPVPIVQHLADRLIPELFWLWDELKGIGYSNEDDELDNVTKSSACVIGRAS